jgi:hypothetical protein
MKRVSLVDTVAYFYLLLFLYTGLLAFTDVQAFLQRLFSWPIIEVAPGTVAWLLPIIQLGLTVDQPEARDPQARVLFDSMHNRPFPCQ